MATRSPPSRRASTSWRRRENSPFAVIADEKRRFYGVQFHPEVVHTPRGATILRQFRAQHRRHRSRNGTCTPSAPRRSRSIRKQVGKGKVICGLSGGVDSSVAAVLIHEAIGDQLTCIFVDTGLMRAGEAEQVVSLFRGHYNIPLIHAEAADLFLGRLEGVSDPEQKRKIIGAAFIDVFDKESAQGRRRGIPGPGHALSRRDRKRLGHRRAVGHHQDRITMSAACRTT